MDALERDYDSKVYLNLVNQENQIYDDNDITYEFDFDTWTLKYSFFGGTDFYMKQVYEVEFPKKNGQLLLNGLIFQELHRTSVAQC